MMLNRSSLRDHVRSLRRDAIHRGDAVFFRALPLFVLLAHAMAAEVIFGCIEHAIDDGYGDPEDLDPNDERQTSRLESVILEVVESFSIQELLTIEYAGWPGGLQYAICIAEIGEDHVLVIHRSHDIPAFMAVAAGRSRKLMEEIRGTPEVLLPRIQVENDRIAEVVIRQELTLSSPDVFRIVRALTGVFVCEEHLLRTDLLMGVSP